MENLKEKLRQIAEQFNGLYVTKRSGYREAYRNYSVQYHAHYRYAEYMSLEWLRILVQDGENALKMYADLDQSPATN